MKLNRTNGKATVRNWVLIALLMGHPARERVVGLGEGDVALLAAHAVEAVEVAAEVVFVLHQVRAVGDELVDVAMPRQMIGQRDLSGLQRPPRVERETIGAGHHVRPVGDGGEARDMRFIEDHGLRSERVELGRLDLLPRMVRDMVVAVGV